MTRMTEQTSGPDDVRPETLMRMHAIAAGLHAGGLAARVYDTGGVLDIRASVCGAGGKGTDVTLDEDGYVTVSYWNDPAATPIEIIEVIGRVLAAITG
jgi:hypothetical protein